MLQRSEHNENSCFSSGHIACLLWYFFSNFPYFILILFKGVMATLAKMRKEKKHTHTHTHTHCFVAQVTTLLHIHFL